MRAVSPTFPAVATVLILISVALLFSLEFLCRRNARLRGVADRMRPVSCGVARADSAGKAGKVVFTQFNVGLGTGVPAGLLIIESTLLMPVRKR